MDTYRIRSDRMPCGRGLEQSEHTRFILVLHDNCPHSTSITPASHPVYPHLSAPCPIKTHWVRTKRTKQSLPVLGQYKPSPTAPFLYPTSIRPKHMPPASAKFHSVRFVQSFSCFRSTLVSARAIVASSFPVRQRRFFIRTALSCFLYASYQLNPFFVRRRPVLARFGLNAHQLPSENDDSGWATGAIRFVLVRCWLG
jgi:hypothetical protein